MVEKDQIKTGDKAKLELKIGYGRDREWDKQNKTRWGEEKRRKGGKEKIIHAHNQITLKQTESKDGGDRRGRCAEERGIEIRKYKYVDAMAQAFFPRITLWFLYNETFSQTCTSYGKLEQVVAIRKVLNLQQKGRVYCMQHKTITFMIWSHLEVIF